MIRTSNCLTKLQRMNQALRHQEPDRVPISDFFWSSFLKRWREELGLAAGTDIYRYYDLDWQVTRPNRDPHIRPFEVLEETSEQITVRTGFEAIIQKKFAYPMPHYLRFETDTLEKMRAFQFDDPWDERRYFAGGDNQTVGVGDQFVRNSPPWIDTVKELYPEFPVYGSVAEGHETLWRIIGQENTLLWIGMYPDEVGRFVDRINEYAVETTKAEIQAGGGMLDGFVIWGDVAYTGGMLFSPEYWRKYFKPGVKAIIDVCHENNLPVIYHGDGDVRPILEDYIEIGVDAYNPLEAKAGLDAIALRRRYGHRLGMCGNMDVIAWAGEPEEALKRNVLTKLNAAKGGGFIFQSDHSIPGNISGPRYEYVLNLVRQHGNYPLQLGEFDLSDLH